MSQLGHLNDFEILEMELRRNCDYGISKTKWESGKRSKRRKNEWWHLNERNAEESQRFISEMSAIASKGDKMHFIKMGKPRNLDVFSPYSQLKMKKRIIKSTNTMSMEWSLLKCGCMSLCRQTFAKWIKSQRVLSIFQVNVSEYFQSFHHFLMIFCSI